GRACPGLERCAAISLVGTLTPRPGLCLGLPLSREAIWFLSPSLCFSALPRKVYPVFRDGQVRTRCAQYGVSQALRPRVLDSWRCGVG
ncbi:MAG: hypothetical protein NZ821_09820, partial [Gloeomargarita sp. SKYB31]|nr:hypothetical protein [Gloeomargarita sp. SKYB31]